MVDAPPESQVGAAGAADIEPVRVFERVRVAVGGAQEGDVVPSAQREPVHLTVREHAPERRLHRRIEPQQLLDRRRRAGTFYAAVDNRAPLVQSATRIARLRICKND